MVKISYLPLFERIFRKIKDNRLKEKILKQLEKIRENPEIGKPMRFDRKGTREIYIQPFRLAYIYTKPQEEIIIVDFYHKDEQ